MRSFERAKTVQFHMSRVNGRNYSIFWDTTYSCYRVIPSREHRPNLIPALPPLN